MVYLRVLAAAAQTDICSTNDFDFILDFFMPQRRGKDQLMVLSRLSLGVVSSFLFTDLPVADLPHLNYQHGVWPRGKNTNWWRSRNGASPSHVLNSSSSRLPRRRVKEL